MIKYNTYSIGGIRHTLRGLLNDIVHSQGLAWSAQHDLCYYVLIKAQDGKGCHIVGDIHNSFFTLCACSS